MNKFYTRGKVLVGTTLAAALLFSGCGSSENFVITNTNNVAAPVAANDAFNALGNATVNQAAAGVLTNDTVNGAAITAFDAVGSNGGTIALNGDGSFTYTPVLGFVGAETFTYTLSNNSGASTATVTMTSTGLGHFVDNTAGPGGDGSQGNPFDTLAAAIAAANTGDTIFVARGDGTSTGLAGAINLPAGVDLVGEGTGLILAQTVVPAGQEPLLTGPITCGGDNTVEGFTIDTNGTSGVIINGVGDAMVANNTFSTSTSTEEYIDVDDATGTTTIDNNIFQPMSSDEYIEIDSTDTNGNITITNNQLNDDNTEDPDEAVEVDLSGTSVMAFIFTGNIITSPSNSSSFSDGLEVDTNGTSQFTITADNNNFTNLGSDAIDIECESTTTLTGSLTNNSATDCDDDGFEVEANNGTVTITGNTITGTTEDGMQLDAEDSGATFIVTSNTVTGSGDNAIDSDDDEDGDMDIAIRNNTLTGSTNAALHASLSNSGNLCMDITDNTVDDDMDFDDQGSGSITVERFGNTTPGPNLGDELKTVNTFTAGTVTAPNGTVVDEVAGFCAIP